ncbi:uncharacterized protein [Linepithema humile]|uniref:uncharacterized protein n=1 Tax=Linepithema humile TaxID=83485 RepID=UPI00351DB909
MLSAISKLFDPLGLIGPVLTVAKILMQGLWETKIDWDDPLPEAILDNWKDFQENLKEVNTLQIPRLIVSLLEDSRFYIQGFCDASESAYGACLYIQSVNKIHGKITVKLLCSKARVAPLKKQSIPRLELCSALLLARLIDKIRQAIHVKIEGIYGWTDSMVVLYWLRGDTSRWKPFVSHRIAEIIEILPAIHWKHVKSSENPADLISRGTTPSRLKDSHLWWQGPEWLTNPHLLARNKELYWELTEDELSEAEVEVKKKSRVCNLNMYQPSAIRMLNETIESLTKDCSTLTKIERSFGYCLRFISNICKKKENRILGRLTLLELNKARRELIKYSQRIYFGEELKSLQDKRQLSQSSQLHQLQAFLDKDGILRVGGRLQEAPEIRKKAPNLVACTMQNYTFAD